MVKEFKYGINSVKYGNCEVPSIILGGGNVNIKGYKTNDFGFAGVGFTEIKESKDIGYSIQEDDEMLIDHSKIEYQILVDNVKSIDVLIDALNTAKTSLIAFENKNEKRTYPETRTRS